MPDLTNWPRAVAQGGKPVLRGSRQACTVRTRSGQPSRAWQAGTPAVRAAIIAAVGHRPRRARLARGVAFGPGSRPRRADQIQAARHRAARGRALRPRPAAVTRPAAR
jgi:hypothetical protein